MRKRRVLAVFFILLGVVLASFSIASLGRSSSFLLNPIASVGNIPASGSLTASTSSTPSAAPVPTPRPTPVPLPDPKVYGPCKSVPVLLYHHIRPTKEILENGQQNISVDEEVFEGQMAYLVSKGYHTLTLSEFFSGLSGTLPSKPIALTFDDGYEDFYTYAYPVLKKNAVKTTVFLPTGLMGNPGYLSWQQVGEMKASGLITFANHTWSHNGLVKASEELVRREVSTAKTQLEEHGLGPVEFFAYPYGSKTETVDKILKELGIKGAFTTLPGWQQCAGLPYGFRRNRVGSAPLSSYGL